MSKDSEHHAVPNHIIAARIATINFHYYPSRKPRVWTATIIMPNAEVHAGDGATQCEALMLANIHWAMHGQNK